ncbi:MAG: M48 family metallopeptidase [Actinomycetota bacterium]|nr:M48 family metallopeptidase [Actinomycetota bacterium]
MATGASPKTPVALYRAVKADPSDFFTSEEVDKSRSYQKPLSRARIVGGAISIASVVAMLVTKLGPAIIDRFARHSPWPVQLTLVLVAFIVISTLTGLPVAIWTDFVHDKKWGFSTQTAGRFIGDQFKGIILGSVLFAILMVPIWALIRSTELWWVWGMVVFIVFSVGIAILFPVLIVPIFNKLTPLQEGPLRSRLTQLAEHAGVDISEYKVMDASKRTKKDNAFFAGMGKTRSVVIFDNMLETPEDQVEVVVAHEIGHWRRGHIRRQIMIAVFTSLATLGFIKWATGFSALLKIAGVTSVKDPGAFVLFVAAFSVASTVLIVVGAWFSRWFEREADFDALELTHNVEAYQALWRSMTSRNLPDLTPNW